MTTTAARVRPHRLSLRARERAIPLILVTPVLLLLSVLFVWPLISTFLLSFREGAAGSAYGVQNYVNFFTDPYNLGVLGRTIAISAVTTVGTLIIGFPIATHLVRARGGVRALIGLIALSPLLISVIVRTYGWTIVLGNRGLLSSITEALGLGSTVLTSTTTAVVIGLVHVLLPFMVLSLLGVLSSANDDMVRAAQNLGASRTRAFIRITLPTSLPGILAGSMLVFTLSAGSFVTPSLLGGNKSMVMPVLAYQQSLVVYDGPSGATITVVLLLAVLASILLYRRALKLLPSQRGTDAGGAF